MSNLIWILFVIWGPFSCGKKPISTHIAKNMLIVTDSFPDFNYVTGRFDPAVHPDFIEIPIQYADRPGRFIRKETLQAFIQMYEAAKRDGLTLKIISATRNFDAQKKIWEDKWYGRRILEDGVNAYRDIADPKERALKILLYSSMPGTSRHHWGTDIDINSLDPKYFSGGKGKKEYQWLSKHGKTFGFCQTYTEFTRERTTGYQPEPWHWTYSPISTIYHSWAENHLKDTMIRGFAGAETAQGIGVVKNFVLGIHPDCKTP